MTRTLPVESAAAPRAGRFRSAKAAFSEIVLVCRKCAKRQGLSKREARALAKAAFRAGASGPDAPRRKPRIVESGCLGPCPKRALAMATGASVAAGRILLLDPAGAPAIPDFGPNAALPGLPGDSQAPDR